ncbi:hypothetical protein B879_04210 [Cecembia lonarensis LW9]|uniref:Uncharacterized protein n=2 Tax=Bacteria TaxID=2 RepID=K1KSQ5_CECL9|nr:hypothetical protein B879_04210 [Cecembia lonarensis LW9]
MEDVYHADAEAFREAHKYFDRREMLYGFGGEALGVDGGWHSAARGGQSGVGAVTLMVQDELVKAVLGKFACHANHCHLSI